MTTEIKLYTTLGCHLCEEAHGMLSYMLQNDAQLGNQFAVQLVEIANDDALVEKYGIRIPVLSIETQELGWPFDMEELHHWLINR